MFQHLQRHRMWLESKGEKGSVLNLSSCHLQHLDFSSMDLRGANLSQTDLTSADFSLSNLQEASLSKAVLVKANLTNTDLRGANLSLAYFNDARMEGTILDSPAVEEGKLCWFQGDKYLLARMGRSGCYTPEETLLLMGKSGAVELPWWSAWTHLEPVPYVK